MLRKLLVGLMLVSSLLTAGAVLVPQPAHAATSAECLSDTSGAIPLIPKWYKYIPRHFEAATGTCVLDAVFPDSIPAILLAVFEIILRITGLAAVIYIIYGGFQYLTTTGEPEKAKNARTTIINALVGMMIVIFATAIVNLVGRNVV